MKRIINGKMYNTETATHIGFWDNELYVTDFNYQGCDLYRKKTGEYFLLSNRGGLPPCLDFTYFEELRSGGKFDVMFILTEAQAKKFVETYLSPEKYEEVFGVVDE